MCTKSQKDGKNHKNTGVRRAIFHKRGSSVFGVILPFYIGTKWVKIPPKAVILAAFSHGFFDAFPYSI